MEFDLTGLTGLGTGAIILVLIFRTLWRTDDSWKALLDAERRRATEMTVDAAAARGDAAQAREDARHARADAADAREAARIAQRAFDHCEIEHAATRDRLDRLVTHLRTTGIPMPDDFD